MYLFFQRKAIYAIEKKYAILCYEEAKLHSIDRAVQIQLLLYAWPRDWRTVEERNLDSTGFSELHAIINMA